MFDVLCLCDWPVRRVELQFEPEYRVWGLHKSHVQPFSEFQSGLSNSRDDRTDFLRMDMHITDLQKHSGVQCSMCHLPRQFLVSIQTSDRVPPKFRLSLHRESSPTQLQVQCRFYRRRGVELKYPPAQRADLAPGRLVRHQLRRLLCWKILDGYWRHHVQQVSQLHFRNVLCQSGLQQFEYMHGVWGRHLLKRIWRLHELHLHHVRGGGVLVSISERLPGVLSGKVQGGCRMLRVLKHSGRRLQPVLQGELVKCHWEDDDVRLVQCGNLLVSSGNTRGPDVPGLRGGDHLSRPGRKLLRLSAGDIRAHGKHGLLEMSVPHVPGRDPPGGRVGLQAVPEARSYMSKGANWT